MEYLYILKQALIWVLTAFWCYQFVISLCALVKLKDKPYLVNKNYVKEFTYEWVKMLNGDVLNISKINRADVRRKILESAADEFKNI